MFPLGLLEARLAVLAGKGRNGTLGLSRAAAALFVALRLASVLLRLDQRQRCAEPFITHHIALLNTRALVVYAEGQDAALIQHLKTAVRVVVNIHAAMNERVGVKAVLMDSRV